MKPLRIVPYMAHGPASNDDEFIAFMRQAWPIDEANRLLFCYYLERDPVWIVRAHDFARENRLPIPPAWRQARDWARRQRRRTGKRMADAPRLALALQAARTLTRPGFAFAALGLPAVKPREHKRLRARLNALVADRARIRTSTAKVMLHRHAWAWRRITAVRRTSTSRATASYPRWLAPAPITDTSE